MNVTTPEDCGALSFKMIEENFEADLTTQCLSTWESAAPPLKTPETLRIKSNSKVTNKRLSGLPQSNPKVTPKVTFWP